MRSQIVLLLCAAVLAVATPASAQHRQQHFQPQPHFQQHFQAQPHFQQHFRGGGYGGGGYYGGGGVYYGGDSYYVEQPPQQYCYDSNTGNFIHWGACTDEDYVPAQE